MPERKGMEMKMETGRGSEDSASVVHSVTGALPEVVIVGRPNVGKSTMFNRLARKRVSIVAPISGVTRDCVSIVVKCLEKYVRMVDTAGAFFSDLTDRHAMEAVRRADLVILMVDARAGLLPDDEKLARILREEGKRVVVAANKVDHPDLLPLAAEFHRLGISPVVPCSAANGFGVAELTEWMDSVLPRVDFMLPEAVKIAVVGARNVGKSTLVNTICGDERVIVSDVPGTTRDAVDVDVEVDGRYFTLIDTAGMLRRSRVKDDVEFYSMVRSRKAIRRADVCLFLLDCTRKISRVDKQIGGMILDEGKPCVIVVNKWDLVGERASPEDFQGYVGANLPHMDFVPMAFVSAAEGFNVKETLALAVELYERSRRRVPTSLVNRSIEKILRARQPSVKGARAFKVYYAAQTDVAPPSFLLFVNDAETLRKEYLKYMESSLRSLLGFEEVPIRLTLRSHSDSGDRGGR